MRIVRACIQGRYYAFSDVWPGLSLDSLEQIV